MVVWVRRLAADLDGATSSAVLVVGAMVLGHGAAGRSGVMVYCPPRRTTFARTLFQAASWCVRFHRGSFATTTHPGMSSRLAFLP